MELAVALITILARYGPEAYLQARQIAGVRAMTPEQLEAELSKLDVILQKTGASYFTNVPVGTTAGKTP